MAHTTSIYYPWIEVRDTGWLRTACLYWDVIQTIVPQSIGRPYEDADSRDLEDDGVLQPFYVAPDLDVVEDITDDFINYLETDQAKAIILGGTDRHSYIHPEKLSPAVRKLSYIHPEKLPYALHDMLRDAHIVHRGERGWLRMNEPLAAYYMTLLATRISNQIGASVVTDENGADGLNLVVKAGASLPNPIMLNPDARRWRDRRYRRMSAPLELVEGALATLALDGIRLDPEVPISRLLRFRRDHADELGRFRTAIAELASQIEEELPLEAMRQRVWDLYTNELQPSVSDLKSALDGHRIGWLAKAILKTSFLSAGSTSLLATVGLSIPQALLAGAGISLVAMGMLYSSDKRGDIRRNPFSYLLRAEQNFGL